jgi:glycosyltransferase involved in cell wall biosynthesis
MPTYNTHESHLREAIESVLNQTFTDFEFLILDDGSANAAQIQDIALSFNDQRIKFSANEKNLGISPSRNKLIEIAQGEYLAVHDHDDISLPDRLQKEVDFLDQNPDVGVVSGPSHMIPRGKMYRCPSDHDTIEKLLLFACVLLHPAAMIRKKVLVDNGLFYEAEYSPAEDHALWCRLIGKTRFANLTDVLLHYRFHHENTSRLRSEEIADAIYRVNSFARSAHPSLWYRAQNCVIIERRYRLFGVLPLMTIRTQNRKTNYLLFGFLRVLKCNEIEDLTGRSMGAI